MLGIRFVKFEPNTFIFKYRRGKEIQKGTGLSFWYYAPTTSMVKIPVESKSTPFIFEEFTSDYQTITVQGEIIYNISDPEKIKDHINFTIDSQKLSYLSEDPFKLDQRIINTVKTIIKKEIEIISLKEAIKATAAITRNVQLNLSKNEYLNSLGIQITTINILSVLPTKETARALEAETREKILKEADNALYERRNAAVEQERRIKENELNTDIAVENKKRQIRETQMEAERSIKEKEHALQAEELKFRIQQEEENKKLVELVLQNKKAESNARAYSIEAILSAFNKINPEMLKILALTGMQPDQLIAQAFNGLASSAEKIGELNITPDLLSILLSRKK